MYSPDVCIITLCMSNLCMPRDGCLLVPTLSPACLGGLLALRRGGCKLVGNLTMPIGAVRKGRLPVGPPLARSAARPGWGPSQGLVLSITVDSLADAGLALD